jgi:hypothetical protein
MSEIVISPKFHVGQTVYADFIPNGPSMTIEKVEIVSYVCYIIDGQSWGEDELYATSTDTALKEFISYVETFKETEERLRANREANAKIEEAKVELERSTKCKHTYLFGGHGQLQLYYNFCPDCGEKL